MAGIDLYALVITKFMIADLLCTAPQPGVMRHGWERAVATCQRFGLNLQPRLQPRLES